ncbi:MAG: hypothetical protein PVG65_00580 [Candidatus Thorarchaeota archaeon]|jgi:hypothetical protein
MKKVIIDENHGTTGIYKIIIKLESKLEEDFVYILTGNLINCDYGGIVFMEKYNSSQCDYYFKEDVIDRLEKRVKKFEEKIDNYSKNGIGLYKIFKHFKLRQDSEATKLKRIEKNYIDKIESLENKIKKMEDLIFSNYNEFKLSEENLKAELD